MSLKWESFAVVGAVVTVAVSMAVTLWAGAGLSWPYAALVALLATALMIPLSLRSQAGATRGAAAGANAKLEANLAGLSRRLQEVERRLVELDERMIDVSRTTVRAVANELDTVGSVMRDLAEAVALHDAELFAPRTPRDSAPAARARSGPPASEPAAAPAGSAPAVADAPEPPPEPAAPRISAEEVDAVSRAIRGEQVELMLQAVVTLPQRRVRLYEAQSRVRLPGGLHAPSARVAAIAEAQGLSRDLDHFVLHHAIRVARHLASRNRDVPVIFRGSATALLDAEVFRLVAAAVAADPPFASRILFEMPLAAFRDAGALEREGLDALAQLGIRFVLDQMPDLVLEARSLAVRGVRYVRIPVATLLGAANGVVRTEIHPADLAGYLARHGLSLIVEGVDSEAVSMEILDFDVPLGIGPLYAPPRTVRMDVLDEAAASVPSEPAASAAAPDPVGQAAAPSAPAPAAAVSPRLSAATMTRADAEGAAEPEDGAAPAPEGATRARGTSLRAFLRRTSG